MSIQRVPRVGFCLELLPARRARKILAETFQQHLSEHFGPVRLYRRFIIFPVAMLTFKVGGKEFVVAIKREKEKVHDVDEWYVAIDAFEYRLATKHSPKELGKIARKCARDLMLISDEIHAVLTKAFPGATRLRWYFEGWNVKKPGVPTPAELPWHIDAPELRSPENQVSGGFRTIY